MYCSTIPKQNLVLDLIKRRTNTLLSKNYFFFFFALVQYVFLWVDIPSSLCYSEDAVALIIAYHFHDNTTSQVFAEPALKRVKSQLFSPAKRNVLDYSKIKLPAAAFGYYLANDCKTYLLDCLRYKRVFNAAPPPPLFCVLCVFKP